MKVTLFGKCTSKCLRVRKELKEKKQMYEHAQGMIDREFDIVNLIRRLRKFTLMKNIMLTKAQRKLIRYFKNNVVPNPRDPNYSQYKSVRDEFEVEKASKIPVFGSLQKITAKDELSVIDKKVLKGLIWKKQIPNILGKEESVFLDSLECKDLHFTPNDIRKTTLILNMDDDDDQIEREIDRVSPQNLVTERSLVQGSEIPKETVGEGDLFTLKLFGKKGGGET